MFRKRYVEKFYDSVNKYQGSSAGSSGDEDKDRREDCIVDIWALLECVLDCNFKKLSTHVAFPGTEPNPKLITVISECSPHLEKLMLTFKLMKAETKLETLKPFILSLKSLEHLTDLKLVEMNENLRPTLLSLIGISCPVLSRLVVKSAAGAGCITKEEILALLIGERALGMIPKTSEDPEPECLEDSQFACLELSRTPLTPMCYTLKELRLVSSGELFASAGALILRHLPLLQVLSIPGTTTSMAVKIFHDQFRFQKIFEKDFESASLHHSEGSPPQTVLQPILSSVSSGNFFILFTHFIKII